MVEDQGKRKKDPNPIIKNEIEIADSIENNAKDKDNTVNKANKEIKDKDREIVKSIIKIEITLMLLK